MVRLREIPRTAAFAWSPGENVPLVVTGTRAGAVDADFSDETKLELWDLSLDNLEQGVELQPIASLSTDSRYFQRLCIWRNMLIFPLTQIPRYCMGSCLR
jgi:protein transport protein SEC31